MEPQIFNLCNSFGTCKEVWDYLKFLYASNDTRVYDVLANFFQLQQGDKDFTEYYGEVKKCLEEMNDVMPLSNNPWEMQKQRDRLAVVKLLQGLKPELESMKSQVLGSSELPSLAEVYSHISRVSA